MAQLNKLSVLKEQKICCAGDAVDWLKTIFLRWNIRWCHFCDISGLTKHSCISFAEHLDTVP